VRSENYNFISLFRSQATMKDHIKQYYNLQFLKITFALNFWLMLKIYNVLKRNVLLQQITII